MGIIGKSGAGKSTLLNMISGVDELTSGKVRIRNVSVHDLSENQRSLWRGRTVGVVYQTFQLLPKLNLIENILLPMDFCGLFARSRAGRGQWICSDKWNWKNMPVNCLL